MPEQTKLNEKGHLRIVSYPDIIFFWPTILIGLLFGFMTHWDINIFNETKMGPNNIYPQASSTLGFLCVLGFMTNFIFIFIDFGRKLFFYSLLGISMFAFLLFISNIKGSGFLFSPLRAFIKQMNIQVNAPFYFSFSAILGLTLFSVYFSKIWNYWVFEDNRVRKKTNGFTLTHYEGVFPRKEECYFFPVEIRVTKAISNTFKFMLFGAGTLIFSHPDDPQKIIVLENVKFINHKEKFIRERLATG